MLRPLLGMQKRWVLVLVLELLWWLFTGVLVYLVLHPIYEVMHVWPFERSNIICVVILTTFTRYIFLLEHTFLARWQEGKVVVMLLMFPAAFLLIEDVYGYMRYIDNYSWQPITGHLPPSGRANIEAYLGFEMMFFGIGGIVSAPILAVRMFLSVWRTRNRNTV